LQDRFAESILSTLIEIAPKLLRQPEDYELRANMMWCATMALNGLISLGVPQDWATHRIGHEITALYGLDHAQTLAIVLPSLLRNQIAEKEAKLVQYAERVWQVTSGSNQEKAQMAITKTEEFFSSLGVKTKLSDYNILAAEAAEKIKTRFNERGWQLGERKNIDGAAAEKIVLGC